MGCHVIGSMDRLGTAKVVHFLRSLRNVGFDGDIHMLVRRESAATLRDLADADVHVHPVPVSSFQIVVDRFRTLSDVCDTLDPDDWVVAADTTDIVFQRNPMDYLSLIPDDKRIVVASECIPFQYQWWTAPNLMMSFPEHWQSMKDKVFYNAGSIGGRACDIAELSREIYGMCIVKPKATGHDQAAMNILLQSDQFRDRTLFSRANGGWCYCIASTIQAKPHERKWLQEPLCKMVGPVCVTEGGTIPVMFHHYNRDHRLDKLIRRHVDEQYASNAVEKRLRRVRMKVDLIRESLCAVKRTLGQIPG